MKESASVLEECYYGAAFGACAVRRWNSVVSIKPLSNCAVQSRSDTDYVIGIPQDRTWLGAAMSGVDPDTPGRHAPTIRRAVLARLHQMMAPRTALGSIAPSRRCAAVVPPSSAGSTRMIRAHHEDVAAALQLTPTNSQRSSTTVDCSVTAGSTTADVRGASSEKPPAATGRTTGGTGASHRRQRSSTPSDNATLDNIGNDAAADGANDIGDNDADDATNESGGDDTADTEHHTTAADTSSLRASRTVAGTGTPPRRQRIPSPADSSANAEHACDADNTGTGNTATMTTPVVGPVVGVAACIDGCVMPAADDAGNAGGATGELRTASPTHEARVARLIKQNDALVAELTQARRASLAAHEQRGQAKDAVLALCAAQPR